MLVVVSPAKSLNWDPVEGVTPTQPAFQKEALRLAKTSRQLTLGGLQKLMSISPDLARLNRERFKAFEAEPALETVRPAALAFAGDTYRGLDAGSFSKDDFDWAQQHLRILSGLYGLLRPLDAIQPYRLEMGSRLKTRRGASLYDFWGADIAKALNEQAAETDTSVLVNCASQEYFGAVDTKVLRPTIITPVFLEERAGTAKVISFFAKRARGAMARYIVQNKITQAEGVKDFGTGGYQFSPDRSDETHWVFTRDYPET